MNKQLKNEDSKQLGFKTGFKVTMGVLVAQLVGIFIVLMFVGLTIGGIFYSLTH